MVSNRIVSRVGEQRTAAFIPSTADYSTVLLQVNSDEYPVLERTGVARLERLPDDTSTTMVKVYTNRIEQLPENPAQGLGAEVRA